MPATSTNLPESDSYVRPVSLTWLLLRVTGRLLKLYFRPGYAVVAVLYFVVIVVVVVVDLCVCFLR